MTRSGWSGSPTASRRASAKPDSLATGPRFDNRQRPGFTADPVGTPYDALARLRLRRAKTRKWGLRKDGARHALVLGQTLVERNQLQARGSGEGGQIGVAPDVG